jgi:hypothetical protein
MAGRIPLILDGGPCEVGLESTVVDVTGDVPRVLRPGGVTPEMIRRVAGAVLVDESALKPLREGEPARSPGMKYRHYAPKGRLTIVRGEGAKVAEAIAGAYDTAVAAGEKCAILASSGARYGGRAVRALGIPPGRSPPASSPRCGDGRSGGYAPVRRGGGHRRRGPRGHEPAGPRRGL